MTVSTTTSYLYPRAAGNGVTTTFNFPFEILSASDLVVGLVDSSGAYYIKTLNVDYTVSGVGVSSGGSVTFNVPPASGYTVDMRTATAQTQPTAFSNQGKYLANTVESALDRNMRALQDVYRQTYTFGIHGPDNEVTTWPALPAAAYRANTQLVFDSLGRPALGTLTAGALTSSTVGAVLYPQSAAEVASGATPVLLNYEWGNVLRYGADPTGAQDSTPAWNKALAQRLQNGARIRFPAGLYRGNFVLTGQYVDVECQNFAYEDVATRGFIANNLSLPVWSIGDGATLTTSVRITGGLKLHGQGTANLGLLIKSVQNVWIEGLVSRGFLLNALTYTASTALPSSYVFINNYRLDGPAGATNCNVLTVYQPSNYPTSYATSLYLNAGALQSNTGINTGVQVYANSTIYVSNSYWTMVDGAGIFFLDAAGTGQIICSNLEVDTLTTNAATLVSIAGNYPLQQFMTGGVSINGKVSINGTKSTAALAQSSTLGPRPMLLYPSITGTLDFQDSSAAAANQTVGAQQAQTMYRGGTNFFWSNTAGALVAQGTQLQVSNAAGNADGIIKFATSNIQVFTGTGAPTASAAQGSLYLRTDGSSTSTRLYVNTNGSTGWTAITTAT